MVEKEIQGSNFSPKDFIEKLTSCELPFCSDESE